MIYRLILFIFYLQITACSSKLSERSELDDVCSKETIESIERQLKTSDAQGHGPDIGSSEWFSVVERRLGIEGDATIPDKDTKAWCDYVIYRD